MVLQLSGPIKFSELRTEFNSAGTGAIKFSDYYGDATTNYTYLISNIPINNLINLIKLSMFYGKQVYIAIAYVIGNSTPYAVSYSINNSITLIYTPLGYSIIFTGNTTCKILLIGGGGGGGYSMGGGGGGGRAYYNNSVGFLPNQIYKIFPGNKGLGGTSGLAATAGSRTSIQNNSGTILYDAAGTNAGSSGSTTSGGSGGAGGNASRTITVIDGITTGNPSTSSYFICGFGTTNIGGGGAGAGGDGTDPTGGIGYTSTISGSSITYAYGGDGGLQTSSTNGNSNYGSGGSGGKINFAGNAGISGVVIINPSVYIKN